MRAWAAPAWEARPRPSRAAAKVHSSLRLLSARPAVLAMRSAAVRRQAREKLTGSAADGRRRGGQEADIDARVQARPGAGRDGPPAAGNGRVGALGRQAAAVARLCA